MKTANFGRNYKVLGSLQGAAAFALMSVLALGGTAQAQVTLDVATVVTDADYTPGENVNVTITIDRTVQTGGLDEDVTALGGELTLPTGWTLALDADLDCAPVPQEGQTSLDNQAAGVNARVQFKRNQALFQDPPANTTCTPVPDTGSLLEFFWLDAQANNPLPVDFPVVLRLVLTAAPGSTGAQNLDLQVKYRVDTGQEQVTDPAPVSIDQGQSSGCATVAGDADGGGGVDTDDVQLAFDAILEIPEAVAALNAECADFCGDNGLDTDDVQGIFNFILEIPDPCNS